MVVLESPLRVVLLVPVRLEHKPLVELVNLVQVVVDCLLPLLSQRQNLHVHLMLRRDEGWHLDFLQEVCQNVLGVYVEGA